MITEVVDHASVRDRAAALGCSIPERIALLPINFVSALSRADFQQRSEAATVRKLFRINAIPTDELLSKEERLPYIQNNAFEWIAPVLFISASIWSENATAVSVALNVLSSYLADYFKGMAGKKTVKLEVVVERKGNYTCKKLTYEGDISGLPDLAGAIEKIANE